MTESGDDIYKGRVWSKTWGPHEKVERPLYSGPRLDPTNFEKLKRKGDRLNQVLELRRKLLAAEPLELVIGTGGLAQSIKFTDEFEQVVRDRMIRDLEVDANNIAEEMRELGVAVDLPL